MLGPVSAEEAVSAMTVFRRKYAVGGSEKRPDGQSSESKIMAERSEGARLLQLFWPSCLNLWHFEAILYKIELL